MKIDIVVPSVGESVTEATVGAFLVSEGASVSEGQEILELETDKVNQVLYAPKGGVIRFLIPSGQTVKPGDILAVIDSEQTTLEIPEAKEISPTPPPQVLQESPEESRGVSEGGKTRKRMSVLRKAIASKLLEVKNTTALLTTFNEVDMSKVIAVREKEKHRFLEKHGVKLGFMSFFARAVTNALAAYPIIHSVIEGEDIVTPESYDIGIAVATDKGLVVPVIRGCDALPLYALEKTIGERAAKAREGKLSLEDLRGGSFTITNGGVFGSLLSTPIIHPSQSAILGMHAIQERPIAENGSVVIRPMMYLALSYDHRIIDGKEAVLFLVMVKQELEHIEERLKSDDF